MRNYEQQEVLSKLNTREIHFLLFVLRAAMGDSFATEREMAEVLLIDRDSAIEVLAGCSRVQEYLDGKAAYEAYLFGLTADALKRENKDDGRIF